MLYFVLVWFLLTGICFSVGLALLNYFQVKSFQRSGDRFFVAIWLGLVVLANAFLAISLITPLSPLIGLLTLGTFGTLALWSSQVRTDALRLMLKVTDQWFFITIVLAAITAALTSRQVTWFDTGLYHFGAIRWMANYGAVPGVALINSGFGFVSSWFALAAPFNPDLLGSKASAVLNGYILFLSLSHVSSAARYISKAKAKRYDWFILLSLFLILTLLISTTFLSAVLISPSPDIPVILLTVVVAWSILLISEQSEHKSCQSQTSAPTSAAPPPNSQIVPLILGIGAVTFKLNGLPVFLIGVLFYGICHRRNIWRLGIGCLFTICLLLPMLVFGAIASGYPLYPSSLLYVPFPWALPPQQASLALSDINGWEAWFVAAPQGTNAWMWRFSQWLQLAQTNKLMLLLGLISGVIAIWLLRRAYLKRSLGDSLIVLYSFLGMGFILWQAPLLRFGLGYFVMLPALIISSICEARYPLSKSPTPLSNLAVQLPKTSILLVLFITGLIFSRTNGTLLRQQLLLPPGLPSAVVATKQANDVRYFSPKGSQKCWGATVPCVQGELADTVWLRNPEKGIASGFKKTSSPSPRSR